MAAGGKLYQLHAMEYTYGSMEGVVFTLQAIQALRKRAPDVCLPSHGDEPADHFIDLFWARLLPYVAVVPPGQELVYRLLLRNNLARPATYAARLVPPAGWESSPEFASLRLEAGGRGELKLRARAPRAPDGVRRLLTAEITIDGRSQGPVSEALVTVIAPLGA